MLIIICREKLCLGDIMCILHIVFDNYYLQIIIANVNCLPCTRQDTKHWGYQDHETQFFVLQNLIFVEGNKLTWGSAYYIIRAVTEG